MVSVQQAEEIIQSVPAVVRPETVPLNHAVNRVLAEEVTADRDLPPFNRVAMDGFAVDSRGFSPGKRYTVAGMQAAGDDPLLLAHPDTCIEIMTGAVLPGGADAVIPYEWGTANETTFTPHPHITITPWMNVHRKGTDARQGETILATGTVISPAEVAVLASVGKALVNVYAFPATALVSTGNELVPVQARPLAHQIRQSNTPALQAAMATMGWKVDLFHFKDDYNHLYTSIENLLGQYDVLIVTGGVSKGKFDYLPQVLEKLKVKKLFHSVAQKPGKPFWYGHRPDGKVVFALPGNPVSAHLCFYRYIRPWILRSMKVTVPGVQAMLASEVRFEPPLTYFLQVQIRTEQGVLRAFPVAGHGSGDFINLKNVHGFLELPANQNEFKSGEAYTFIPFRTPF